MFGAFPAKIGTSIPVKLTEPLFPFTHRHVLQTALPLGGIGAGCICLNGYGGLQDFSIYNKPHVTALRDANRPAEAAFALLHVKGKHPVSRLVEGPMPEGKIYDQGLQVMGYRKGGYEGLPRFAKSAFRSGYPFGRVDLSDPKVPLKVEITGWSPFVPLDDVSSGIPCAIVEYKLRNASTAPVEFAFSYHLSHLATGSEPIAEGSRNEVIPGKGVFFTNDDPSGSPLHGSASLTVIGRRPKVKAMWLRSGWFDSICSLWRECEAGTFATNDGKLDAGKPGRNGGSILVSAKLAPGQETVIPVVLTWYFPNQNCEIGWDPKARGRHGPFHWRVFYASQWSDARAVAFHVHRFYDRLRERTVAFQRSLLESTLPKEVLDAVSANLAILKSPTVLRQENGNLWGWEGCRGDGGSCHGSCTHVWNYAQAFPHLYPQLERTLREQELERSMDERGHVSFRSALPDGPPPHTGHAAADGQLGGIMKVYRDWQISGNMAWLKRLYPLVKRSLDYCIETWDPDRLGVLVEPHHNTYDIEFYGPDGMCSSVYLGALSAMTLMAGALGRTEDAKKYRELAERGARYMEEHLFNGEFFQQNVQTGGLRDNTFQETLAGRGPRRSSNGLLALLRKEGPRHQYGSGCLSDGVIGAWMAALYGFETPLDRRKVRRNLQSIYRYNFRTNLREHANCQRPGYALGNEPGLLLCSWPRGGKPTLPFVYSDEVWTGIEYQVATHMIMEGLVKEGLQIVKAVRSRYDGAVRNPWNEYECGSYYARAMASYALLGTLSGFRYSAVDETLRLAPALEGKMKFFFSTATAFGSMTLGKGALEILVVEGKLPIKRLVVRSGGKTWDAEITLTAKAGKPLRIPLRGKA
jgi:uncharacterized protein (DUF608 family)